jgi:hypothetical protein
VDLRRWSEFAFGIGVFMCGGAFLLLALERLNAPVLVGAPAVAVSPAPIVAVVRRPSVAVVRRPSVARIAVVRRPAAANRARTPHAIAARPRPRPVVIVAAAPVPSHARPLAARPIIERPRAMSQPAKHAVYRPAARRSPPPRILALAHPAHRSKNALYRRPVSERTPEPPIGYDDHPALLRSDGPSAAMPTMEPVQVELTTAHLGR